MNTNILRVFCILLIVVSFVSCKKKKTKAQSEKDEEIITTYISNNNLDAKSAGSGLYYVIKKEGTGAQPSSNSSVKVVYKGYLSDGTVFDQSKTEGYTTSLAQVIKGWQQGIPYFKKGGTGMLLIPSALGYGAQATGKIPANSVLVFDIELVDVY